MKLKTLIFTILLSTICVSNGFNVFYLFSHPLVSSTSLGYAAYCCDKQLSPIQAKIIILGVPFVLSTLGATIERAHLQSRQNFPVDREVFFARKEINMIASSLIAAYAFYTSSAKAFQVDLDCFLFGAVFLHSVNRAHTNIKLHFTTLQP